jgi:hypothetical protein
MAKYMDHEGWLKRANRFCLRKLGFAAFEEGDPYEALESSIVAFQSGMPPEDFIRNFFDEDFASSAYNEHLQRESTKETQY